MKLRTLRAVLFLALTFLFTGTAFAATTPFLSQAQDLIDSKCTKRWISNETAILCYLFGQIKRHEDQIASLEVSTSALQTTINDRGASDKALHVLDANDQDLGIYMTDDKVSTTVFVPSLNLRATLGEEGVPKDTLFYDSEDCSGTPYLFLSGSGNYFINNIVRIGPDLYYAIKPGVAATALSEKSKYGLTPTNELKCTTISPSAFTSWYEAEEVTLPFTEPIANPIHFKYQ